MKKYLIPLLIFVTFLHSQQVFEDKVIARVGNEVVTLSEVNEVYETYKAFYPTASEKELKNAILQELVNNKLILHAAKEDTAIAQPSAEEINQALEERIRYLEQQYGTENFENLLKNQGLTRDALKEIYRGTISDEILVQRYIERYVRPKIQVTPQEIRNFYDSYKDSLKEPDMFRISHIFIKANVDSAQEASALKKAQNFYNQIKKGASFEDIANRYSDDRESASYGGSLGAIARNFFPQEIQEKLDKLNPGEISEPISGDFGYHIFKLVNKGDNYYELKHILVKVEPKAEEWNRAYQLALSIKNKIEVQKQNFEELAKTYSDDESTKELGGDMGWIPVNNLPEEFQGKISALKTGEITIIKDQLGYHIVKVTDKKTGRTPEFSEIQNNIKQHIENQKIQEEISKLLAQLRQEIFVEIKEF